MTQSFIVLGLGFGDEGKGRVVDYLASQYDDALVIRFNGGHQAGHTVWHEGSPHIFSSFGSGTFRDAPTYISRHCTVHPEHFLNELEALDKWGFHNPKVYIDPDAMITTKYDVQVNLRVESGRARDKHGTVGVGFGATIEREEKHYCLRWRDIKYENIFVAKLMNIIKYYGNPGIDHKLNAKAIWEEVTKMAEHVTEARFCDIMLDYTTHIYEGAQGIMLDQNFGFFPNVTRSNTTCENTLGMLRSLGEVDMIYVTRPYGTRHGTGWMPNEDQQPCIELTFVERETNNDEGQQGEFRKGLLSLELLWYAVECNRSILPISRDKEHLFVTCCDQAPIFLGESEKTITPIILAEHLGIRGDTYESRNHSGPIFTYPKQIS